MDEEQVLESLDTLGEFLCATLNDEQHRKIQILLRSSSPSSLSVLAPLLEVVEKTGAGPGDLSGDEKERLGAVLAAALDAAEVEEGEAHPSDLGVAHPSDPGLGLLVSEAGSALSAAELEGGGGVDGGEVTPWVNIGVLVGKDTDMYVFTHVMDVLSRVRLLGMRGSPFKVLSVAVDEGGEGGEGGEGVDVVVKSRSGFRVVADVVRSMAPPLDVIIVPPVWKSDTELAESVADGLVGLGPNVPAWVGTKSKVAQFTIGIALDPTSRQFVAHFSVFGAPASDSEPVPLDVMLSRIASHWLGASGSIPALSSFSYTV